jgi:hypothetical protein
MVTLLATTFHVAGMTGMHHHYLAYWLRWSLANFLPGLVLNSDLPDLQVAGIPGVRHCAWPELFNLFHWNVYLFMHLAYTFNNRGL